MANSFVNYTLGLYAIFKAQEEKMCKEFDQRAEEARKLYWDACKYPRKKKKKIRKQAVEDFRFYKQLAQPIIFF